MAPRVDTRVASTEALLIHQPCLNLIYPEACVDSMHTMICLHVFTCITNTFEGEEYIQDKQVLWPKRDPIMQRFWNKE